MKWKGGEPGWQVLVCSLLACFAAFCIWRVIRRRVFYDLHKVPGPKGWPLVGNLPQISGANSTQFHKVLAKWTEEFGQVYKFVIGRDAVLVLTDPEEIVNLCSNSNKQDNLPKFWKAYLPIEARAPHLSMLSTPDYEEWKSLRKATSVAFSPENIRKAYPKILQAASQAAHVLSKLGPQGSVDVGNLAARLTAEVINQFAFDQDIETMTLETAPDGSLRLAPHALIQVVKERLGAMSMSFTTPGLTVLYALLPWLPGARQQQSNNQVWVKHEDELARFIKKQGLQPTENSAVWACLGRLLNPKDSYCLTDDGLAANASLFFVAGYETTSNLITFAMLELAADQSLQDRVRQELKAAGLTPTSAMPQPRQLQYADLTKLPVLDSVVRETLRLHPTAPIGSFRMTDRDMVIGGYRVPKGTPISLPPYCLHTDAANFDQPLRFWPERWTQPAVSAEKPVTKGKGYLEATPAGNLRNPTASWNPFSCGPRNCIGQALALAEARTTLAVWLANFHFELAEGISRDAFLEKQQVYMITLQTRHGLPLKVVPINTHAGDA